MSLTALDLTAASSRDATGLGDATTFFWPGLHQHLTVDRVGNEARLMGTVMQFVKRRLVNLGLELDAWPKDYAHEPVAIYRAFYLILVRNGTEAGRACVVEEPEHVACR